MFANNVSEKDLANIEYVKKRKLLQLNNKKTNNPILKNRQ